MTHHWDEFSKSLAQPLPRRESLRRLGLFVAGAVFSPLGLESAFAGKTDPCKAFCKCGNKRQQDQCLRTCRACSKNVSRLGGSCGNYFCCGAGQTSCGSYCADLTSDPWNCGGCGQECNEPRPYEYGVCIDGRCEYPCAEGATDCDGTCTLLDWDPSNCGECGYVCPGSAPYCNLGVCSVCPPGAALCGDECVDLLNDPDNCGACGNSCGENSCIQGWCYVPCAEGLIRCNGVCIDPMNDPFNCGNCGVQCEPSMICITGYCEGGGGGWW
jgi:hypothetical protein